VNLTDDGWFPPEVEPLQHLNGIRLRAIETHRTLVRASNSGISAILSPQGELIGSLAVASGGTLRASVPLAGSITFYSRWGDWPVWLSLAYIAEIMNIGRFVRQ